MPMPPEASSTPPEQERPAGDRPQVPAEDAFLVAFHALLPLAERAIGEPPQPGSPPSPAPERLGPQEAATPSSLASEVSVKAKAQVPLEGPPSSSPAPENGRIAPRPQDATASSLASKPFGGDPPSVTEQTHAPLPVPRILKRGTIPQGGAIQESANPFPVAEETRRHAPRNQPTGALRLLPLPGNTVAMTAAAPLPAIVAPAIPPRERGADHTAPRPPVSEEASLPRSLPHASQPPAEIIPQTLQESPAGRIGIPPGERTDVAPALTQTGNPAPRPDTAMPETRYTPETARAVATQLNVAITKPHSGQIDLALSPEELGRVRMSLSGQEGNLAVSMSVERGETLDLMRRHLEMLSQEFRNAGYNSVSFSFSRQQQHGRGAFSPPELSALPPDDSPKDPPRPRQMAGALHPGGLDLRL